MGHGASLYPLYKYRIWQEFRPDSKVPLNERIYPLLRTALQDPTFYHLRNKILFDALKGLGSYQQQYRELRAIFDKIDPDVEADLHKSALQNTFVGDYPIPYSNSQYEDAKEKLFEWIRNRQIFIMDELLKTDVKVSVHDNTAEGTVHFLIEVKGHSAVLFNPKKLSGEVFSDRKLNGNAVQRESNEILLYPGVKEYVGQNWILHTFGEGKHQVPGPQRYLFSIKARVGANIAEELKSAFYHSLSGKKLIPNIQIVTKIANNKYIEIENGIHAWQLDREKDNTIKLGPGVVNLTEDLFILPKQKLFIAPGTKLLLGKNVSIFSWGPVKIEGSVDQKILFNRLEPQSAWGGIALHGSSVNGSKISNVIVSGGSKPDHPIIRHFGMVSIYGVDNISIKNSTFSKNVLSDDTLHIANSYVDLYGLQVKNCFGDCIDFDYAKGNISDLTIQNAGNDGVDFMNSIFEIQNFRISTVIDKGISVGESSNIKISEGQIENALTGVAVKDGSNLDIQGLQLNDNKIAIDMFLKKPIYGNAGRISALNTSFINNDVNLKTERGAEVVFLKQTIPGKTFGNGYVVSSKRLETNK